MNHRLRPTLHAAVCVFTCLLAPLLASAQDLSRSLRQSIDLAGLASANIGISVLDADTHEPLVFGFHDDALLIPASNMKLITSGAALLWLGPDFTFRTELRVNNDTLTIIGSGDPALGDPELLSRLSPPMSADEFIKTLADAITNSTAVTTPITKIVVDDAVFDRTFFHHAWPVEELNQEYSAQVGGLNFHTNIVNVYASPSSHLGAAPSIRTEPSIPWAEFKLEARTVADRTSSLWLTRAPTDNRFTVFGRIGEPARAPVTLHDTGMVFARLLALQLPGNPAVTRAPEGDPRNAGELVAVLTTSIDDVLEGCNTDSKNLYAEALLKRMGHEATGEPGSWPNGAAAVRMKLIETLGHRYATSIVISDGSGLSTDNRLTPALVTAWLVAMRQSETTRDAFTDSLATPGRGTFRTRFRNGSIKGDVRGKTGLLRDSGVRAISGYLTAKDNSRTLAFSIIMNDIPNKGGADLSARKLQEQLVVRIDEWLSEQSRVANVPEN